MRLDSAGGHEAGLRCRVPVIRSNQSELIRVHHVRSLATRLPC